MLFTQVAIIYIIPSNLVIYNILCHQFCIGVLICSMLYCSDVRSRIELYNE